MNKTKRKIFEISMKLFSEKGYEATSIEEITAIVGVAKGTLYYHFNSKEEIFNFLVDEGMKLLINSIEIKISKCINTIEKLKAISLIQLKTIKKYEDFIIIVMSQAWGNEPRNIFCRKKVIEYVELIQKIIEEGLEKKDIRNCNSEVLASQIFSLTCSTLVFKRKKHNQELDIQKLYNEYEKNLINTLII